MSHVPKHDRGFTLVEMILVVAILGILVSMATATYVYTVANSRSITCHANQRVLNGAVSVYTADHGEPPTDIGDLEPYVNSYVKVSHCPSDRSVELGWDADEERVTCPLHPED